jgi:hypothetical protein
MEKRQDTVAFGHQSFEDLCAAFDAGKWMSFEFPDLILRLELDLSIEGDGFIHRHEGRRMETKRLMEYTFPHTYLPDDITKLINHAYTEAIRCYEVCCFMATIALCGRTIETAIGAVYEKVVGVHPSADPSKPGMNAMLNRLTKAKYTFPPALKEKMEVIALHRNMAVHGNLQLPTDDEARSVIYSTRDVLIAVAV